MKHVDSLMQKVRGFLKELMARLHVRVRCRSNNPIFVYQMGKVGSSTVVKTLVTLGLDNAIFHLHTLNKQIFDQAIKVRRRSNEPYLPEHLVVSQHLAWKINKGLFPCKIVTLTREPVSRAISHVFEDWKTKTPDANIEGSLDTRVMEKAIIDLVSKKNGISDPTLWFDNELKYCFGIDVFEVPFDSKKGYSIYKSGPIEVLLLRMADMNRVLNDALVEFLSLEEKSITLVNANVGKGKWYSKSLEEVKEKILIPPNVIENMLNTRYMNHFYYKDIPGIRKKWLMRSSRAD